MEKSWLLTIIRSALAAVIIIFLFPHLAYGGEMRLKQSILPVRFVYLNSDGEIARIWNNVTQKDDFYAIKFYASGSKKEISPTGKNLSNYQELLDRRNCFQEGDIFNYNQREPGGNHKEEFKVDFIKRYKSIEEIHTYV